MGVEAVADELDDGVGEEVVLDGSIGRSIVV